MHLFTCLNILIWTFNVNESTFVITYLYLQTRSNAFFIYFKPGKMSLHVPWKRLHKWFAKILWSVS